MSSNSELHIKLREKLDTYASVRLGFKIVKMDKFLTWIQSGAVKLCPINREEVKTHTSSSEMLLDSAMTKFPIGSPTGYVQRVSCPDDETLTTTTFLRTFYPTPETPIYLPDYGHRFRWLSEIADDKVNFCSFVLTQLKKEDPEAFFRFMHKEVCFELVFSTDGVVPDNYIRDMFTRLNMSAPAASGEKLKATTDEVMDSIIEDFNDELSEFLDLSKDRDGDRTTLAALARGASDVKKMTTRDKDVFGSDPLTDDEGLVARSALGKLVGVYRKVYQILADDLEKAEAKLKELVKPKKTSPPEDHVAYKDAKDLVKSAKDRIARLTNKLEVAFHGPLVYGLSSSPTAEDDIQTFLLKVSETKEAWTSNVPQIKNAKKTAARYHTTDTITGGWNALLRIVGKLGRTSYVSTSDDVDIVVS